MTRPEALVLAPEGRDAAIAAALLQDSGMEPVVSRTLTDFVAKLSDDLALAVLTEDSVRSSDRSGIVKFLANQPAWASIPFILLTRHGGGPERNPEAARLSDALENVTFLERPFHATTFVSLAKSALRSRFRQFEARDRIRELHESQQSLRTALVAGRLETWEFAPRESRLAVYPSFSEIFGYDDGRQMSLEELQAAVHEDDLPAIAEMMQYDGTDNRHFVLEFRVYWPDGSVHWAETHASTSRFPDGSPRITGVTTDITDRKVVESGLRSLNETLELRVAERTAELERTHASMLDEIAQRELTENQLRQAQKMEMIGQLTGGVAHDFNNLLMAVIANLNLLEKHAGEDQRARRLITGAMHGAQRGASLTQRLLAFARRQDLKVEPLDPVNLVRGSAELLSRSVGDLIDLRFRLPEETPLTLIDGNQLDLALLNLVVNARDAMPGGGTITVSAEERVQIEPSDDVPAGHYVVLSVADNGTGMSPETLQQATQPFFSTKELGKGTGLGLSMIQGLAQQLHGALRLFSVPGEGTTAELWLPVAAGSGLTDAPKTPQPEITAIPVTEPSDSRPLRILLVDDDVLIAMSSVELLEDLGHTVTGVYSGDEALKILNTGAQFDMMITDFSMPRMNGAQLSEAARAILPGLPILLATGYAELPDNLELDLPRLAKPYMQQQLDAEITKLMR